MKEQRMMQEAKAAARSVSVEHSGSATLYRHLCHMSEANALAEDLGIRTRYRPHRKEKGTVGAKDEVVCRIFEDGELATEVPLPFFERRFKALQARWNQLVVYKADGQPAKGSKGRASLRTSSQAADLATSTASVATSTVSGGRESSPSRPAPILSQDEQDALQREMKKVTLETLALADRMWQQVEVLEKDRAEQT
jgi:hypothetical protein